MNVQIGQIWEDVDSRRIGRTFKIANIDDGMATCENLTGIGGHPAAKPTAFISLKRFVPRYYRLRPVPKMRPAFSLDMLAPKPKQPVLPKDSVFGAYTPVSFDDVSVVRRAPKAALVEECRMFWPGEWREIGPCIVLNSENNDFEVSIRLLEGWRNPFEVHIKLYQFTIFRGTIHGEVRDALGKVQDFFLVLNHELKNFISGDEK